MFEFLSGLTAAATEGGEDFSTFTLAIDLPVELSVEDGSGGRLQVLAGPSRQRTATTIVPVLHQLRVTLEVEVPDHA